MRFSDETIEIAKELRELLNEFMGCLIADMECVEDDEDDQEVFSGWDD